MKNPFTASNWSISKIFLILWLIFSVVYIAWDIKNKIIKDVYQKGQTQGYQVAIAELISTAQKGCDPIPVNFGENQVQLVNLECLQKQAPATESEAGISPETVEE